MPLHGRPHEEASGSFKRIIYSGFPGKELLKEGEQV
jgi:hypothetical protein